MVERGEIGRSAYNLHAEDHFGHTGTLMRTCGTTPRGTAW